MMYHWTTKTHTSTANQPSTTCQHLMMERARGRCMPRLLCKQLSTSTRSHLSLAMRSTSMHCLDLTCQQPCKQCSTPQSSKHLSRHLKQMLVRCDYRFLAARSLSCWQLCMVLPLVFHICVAGISRHAHVDGRCIGLAGIISYINPWST